MGKDPIDLDWGKLLPVNNSDPPPELEVVKGKLKREDCDDFSALSDQQINEKIQRIKFNINKLQLKDGGAKLRITVKNLEEEVERRKLLQSRKDADECGKPTQSQSSNFSDTSPGFSKSQIRQAPSESKFAKTLTAYIDGSDNGTCKAFNEELQYFGHGNHKTGRPNELPMNSGRHGSRLSFRQKPFQSVCSLAVGKDNVGTSSGNRKAISSSCPPPPVEGNFSTPISSRRTSPVRTSHNLRKRKVETVVVLDEEDAQPLEQTLQVDEGERVKGTKIYYPSRSHPEAVELSSSDLECLNPESPLSSPIMNFYIQYIQRQVSPTGRPRRDYYFFNTYFYKKLEEAMSHTGDKSAFYVKLRRWWKGVNIFQKAYIFLPIHAELHWSLAIICIPAKEDGLGPIILHLDSLGFHDSNQIFKNIESYIKEEWNYLQRESPTDVPFADNIWKHFSRRIVREVIPVPQQKNDFDCGLFVLYFMERFIEEAPERLRKIDLSMFGRKWFKPEEASGLRERIRRLLCEELDHAQHVNQGIESPSCVGDVDGQCHE